MKEFWNERYSNDSFIYGKTPNEYLKIQITDLTRGKILFLGEGEGRNAVYASSLGWQTDAVDYSSTAKDKAIRLAQEFNTTINYEVVDILNYNFKDEFYDAVVMIFLHFDEESRRYVHKKVFETLKTDGVIILEAFEKEQSNRNSGGPKNPDLLYSLEQIVEDFIDFDFIKLTKEEIVLSEGEHHKGTANVIRFVGRKK